MGKKNRPRKLSVYGRLEGDREKAFIRALIEIYKTTSSGINPFFDGNGGDPNKIVGDTLKQCHKDKAFAWLDEDFEPNSPLSQDLRDKLAVCWCITESDLMEFYACSIKDLQQTYNLKNTKKPTLIVSQPVCADGLILQVLYSGPLFSDSELRW